jgi:hypothetical protein
MAKRRYLLLGLWVAIAIPVLTVTAFTIKLIYFYDGKCGGFLPALAGPRPCTLLEYVGVNLALLLPVMLSEFWPLALLGIALPLLIGYVLDLRS